MIGVSKKWAFPLALLLVTCSPAILLLFWGLTQRMGAFWWRRIRIENRTSRTTWSVFLQESLHLTRRSAVPISAFPKCQRPTLFFFYSHHGSGEQSTGRIALGCASETKLSSPLLGAPQNPLSWGKSFRGICSLPDSPKHGPRAARA